MKLKPILTEKSMDLARSGLYSFYVDRHLNKYQIKKLIEEIFSVHVISIKTLNYKAEFKRRYTGRKTIVKAKKKAIVGLRDKEKIDLFETKTKGK